MLRRTTIIVGALFALSTATAALAETPWERAHPRRDQVNDRLASQNRRIRQEVKEGELTKGQAAVLHREDHQVRVEERLMARQNNGHITTLEQAALNQQENRISRQIGE
jgi:hypothetical protein